MQERNPLTGTGRPGTALVTDKRIDNMRDMAFLLKGVASIAFIFLVPHADVPWQMVVVYFVTVVAFHLLWRSQKDATGKQEDKMNQQQSDKPLARGTQVVYVPAHVDLDDVSHPDVEDGFVTSMSVRGDVAFCRFWHRDGPPDRLRTIANSEATPIERLVVRDTRPQEWVNHCLIWIEEQGTHQ